MLIGWTLPQGQYLLEYDQLANGWDFPPGEYGDKDRVFAMRFSWTVLSWRMQAGWRLVVARPGWGGARCPGRRCLARGGTPLKGPFGS